MARTHAERLPKNAHVTAFLVPAGTPGVVVAKKDRKMGQAGAWSADVHLENARVPRSEEHTSELQSLMRTSYAVFCLKKKKKHRLMTVGQSNADDGTSPSNTRRHQKYRDK